MKPPDRFFPLQFALAVASCASLAYLVIGPGGVLLAAIGSGLWLIWRFDNWTGSCLMIAILLLLVLGVLALLIVGMALVK